jgi:hypothetical protein
LSRRAAAAGLAKAGRTAPLSCCGLRLLCLPDDQSAVWKRVLPILMPCPRNGFWTEPHCALPAALQLRLDVPMPLPPVVTCIRSSLGLTAPGSAAPAFLAGVGWNLRLGPRTFGFPWLRSKTVANGFDTPSPFAVLWGCEGLRADPVPNMRVPRAPSFVPRSGGYRQAVAGCCQPERPSCTFANWERRDTTDVSAPAPL